MTEKWKAFLDHKKSFDAFLTDLSEAFDNLPHDIFIATLNANGFDESSLQIMQIMQNYSATRQQRTTAIGRSCYMEFRKVLF